jgi:hypothetical protein
MKKILETKEWRIKVLWFIKLKDGHKELNKKVYLGALVSG